MVMHHDQLTITVATVRHLVDDQFPEWRSLPVREISRTGTVNAIFRLGEELTARFPLRPLDPIAIRESLRAEAAAMAELAAAATVPTPLPVAVGEPGEDYPSPWSVQTWLPGLDATADDPSASSAFAADLAALITALRAVDTRGRSFDGDNRGGHLPDHDEWMESCFRESVGLLDITRLRAIWAELRTLPEVEPDVMCHGDLIPPNVLVHGGRLMGLLDGGGFAAADPALDLVSAWHLLDAAPRATLREALGCSDVQWLRGMAWAFEQALGVVWYYVESNPVMSAWGRRTVERLLGANLA
jgi:aminoglycoside phosphotransferase (APT) family kinase protein